MQEGSQRTPAGLNLCTMFPRQPCKKGRMTQYMILRRRFFPALVPKWDQKNTLPTNEAARRVRGRTDHALAQESAYWPKAAAPENEAEEPESES